MYERALEARERVLGPEHPSTLGSVNNLATLLYRKGDYAGAQPLVERALEARERVLGPEHPSTLASVHNLAALLESKGDYAGAQPWYERALEGLLKISAAIQRPHPDLEAFIDHYARCLRKLGRSDDDIRLHLIEQAAPWGMENAVAKFVESFPLSKGRAVALGVGCALVIGAFALVSWWLGFLKTVGIIAVVLLLLAIVSWIAKRKGD